MYVASVLCVCLVAILLYGMFKLLSGNDYNPPNKYFQNKMEWMKYFIIKAGIALEED